MPASDQDHGMVLFLKSRRPMKQLSVRGNSVATIRQFLEGSHCSLSASPGKEESDYKVTKKRMEFEKGEKKRLS